MSDVILNVPAPIVVQVKQVGKTYVSAPSSGGAGGISRLSGLLDVNVTGQSDGSVLFYNAATGNYVFGTINGGLF